MCPGTDLEQRRVRSECPGNRFHEQNTDSHCRRPCETLSLCIFSTKTKRFCIFPSRTKKEAWERTPPPKKKKSARRATRSGGARPGWTVRSLRAATGIRSLQSRQECVVRPSRFYLRGHRGRERERDCRGPGRSAWGCPQAAPTPCILRVLQQRGRRRAPRPA